MEIKKHELNYWKMIDSEQEDTLKNIDGMVFVLHDSIEFTDIISFLNAIQQDHLKNILYISLTRSYNYMQHSLELFPLTNKRIFIADCVSGFAFTDNDNIDDCRYYKPPYNIETMKKIITFGIEKVNPDIVVVDSMSQFINFSKISTQDLEELFEFLSQIKKNMLNLINNTFILLFDTKISAIHHFSKNDADIILKIEKKDEDATKWITPPAFSSF